MTESDKAAIKAQGEPVAYRCKWKDGILPDCHPQNGWQITDWIHPSNRDSMIVESLYTQAPTIPEGWTQREIELFDGMIDVEEDHAERCDRIANRVMAEKQKGWDLERVALLKKCKAILSAPTIPTGAQKATHANAPKYGTRVLVLTTDADGDPVHELAHYNGEKLGYLGIVGKRIKPVTCWWPLPAVPEFKGETE